MTDFGLSKDPLLGDGDFDSLNRRRKLGHDRKEVRKEWRKELWHPSRLHCSTKKDVANVYGKKRRALLSEHT